MSDDKTSAELIDAVVHAAWSEGSTSLILALSAWRAAGSPKAGDLARLKEQLAAAEKTIEALREMVSKRTYLDICPWCHGRTLDFRQGDQGFGHEDFDLPPRHDPNAKPCPANAEMHQTRAHRDRLAAWAKKRGHAEECHMKGHDEGSEPEVCPITYWRDGRSCPGCTCGLSFAFGEAGGGEA